MRIIENSWHQDTLEYYGEYDDFYSLDFTREKDIRYAINRWLSIRWEDTLYKNLIKENLRYMIMTYDFGSGYVWLPNIDNDLETPNIARENHAEWERLYKNFLLILWDEWFHEPFVEADLSNYRIRVDDEFVRFPHMPELWKNPIYKARSSVGCGQRTMIE